MKLQRPNNWNDQKWFEEYGRKIWIRARCGIACVQGGTCCLLPDHDGEHSPGGTAEERKDQALRQMEVIRRLSPFMPWGGE